jgi:hypothetical protein
MIYNENEENFEDESLEVDGKVVHYKHAVLDKKLDQELINLSEKDQEFIRYSLGDAEDLLMLLPEKKTINNYTTEDLDELLYLWNNKKMAFPHTNEEQFVCAIGSAFGHYLNKEVKTVWTIVNDEYGTDYACAGTTHSFQLFPFSSVWKAVEQNREKSLDGIVLVVKNNIEEWNKK